MSPKIHVSLIDADDEARLFTMQRLTRGAKRWIVTGYRDPYRAIDQIRSTPVDVLILDACLPGIDGIECARLLKSRLPQLPILILAVHMDHMTVMASLAIGISGFLIKPASSKDLISAVTSAIQGLPSLCIEAQSAILRCFQNLPANPTLRERQLLGVLLAGARDKEIAQRLGISTGTVRAHLKHLFKKLGVHNRREAVNSFLARHRE